MTEAEFGVFRERSTKSFAESIVNSRGIPIEEASRLSLSAFSSLLAQGMETRDHFFFALHESEPSEAWIGWLWLGLKPPSEGGLLYIYDIFLEESVRGKGYGEKAMLFAEDHGRQLGVPSIGLNVFGFNAPARKLYEKLGYVPTAIQMRKDLS